MSLAGVLLHANEEGNEGSVKAGRTVRDRMVGSVRRRLEDIGETPGLACRMRILYREMVYDDLCRLKALRFSIAQRL